MMRILKSRTVGLCGVIAACCVMATPSVADESKSVMLAPKMVPGAKHFVEMNDEIETFSRGGFYGEEGVTRKSMRLRTAKRTVAKGSADAKTRVMLTFDRVAMFMETREAPVRFDSDVDDPTDEIDPLAVALGPMLGEEIAVDVDSKGRVVKTSGIDDVYFAVEEAAAGGMLFVQLEEELTEPRMRFYWHDSHACLYPYKKVSVGETWEASSIQPSIYQKDIQRSYVCKVEFIGERDGTEVVDISYEATLKETNDKKSKARMFGISMALKDGHAKGRATYDVKRGQFVTQTEDLTMNLTGTTDAPGPGETSTVESSIKTTHSMTVVTEEQRRAQRAASKSD